MVPRACAWGSIKPSKAKILYALFLLVAGLITNAVVIYSVSVWNDMGGDQSLLFLAWASLFVSFFGLVRSPLFILLAYFISCLLNWYVKKLLLKVTLILVIPLILVVLFYFLAVMLLSITVLPIL